MIKILGVVSIILLIICIFASFWWCIVHYLVVPFVIPLFMSNPVISSTQEWGIVILLMISSMIFSR